MKKHMQVFVSAAETLIGTALTAAAFGMVIVPQGYSTGGVTGFSKIIVSVIPLPLSLMVLVVNISLLGIGLMFVGKKFAAKTVAVSVLFPLLLEVFSHFPLNSIRQDQILCTITAGVMLGVGAGLVLRSGASSGGFDILGVILNKKFQIPIQLVLNLCDASVILMQSLGQPLDRTLYGIAVITISAAIVGRVVTLGTGESHPFRRSLSEGHADEEAHHENRSGRLRRSGRNSQCFGSRIHHGQEVTESA